MKPKGSYKPTPILFLPTIMSEVLRSESMGTPLDLKERIQVAGFNIAVARASYDIWWTYQGADTRPLYLPGMQTYSEFFRYDQEAHFRSVIIGLATLFDKRKDTITLASLIRDAKAAGSDVTTVEAKLAQMDCRVKKIQTLRHKLFAHRNHASVYNDVFKDVKICPDNLKSVLEESLVIVNELADLQQAARTEINDIVAQNVRELLQFIQPKD